jgi:hypothetical protein
VPIAQQPKEESNQGRGSVLKRLYGHEAATFVTRYWRSIGRSFPKNIHKKMGADE